MRKVPKLTRRERDVLAVLCGPRKPDTAFTEPASIHAIADTLGVSEAAVKQHLTNLYEKFGIFDGRERRRTRLANAVLKAGLVPSAPPEEAPQGPEVAVLLRGRAAAQLRNWSRAYELLARADHKGALLSAEDLEWLGEAAMITARHSESVEARQRAQKLYVSEGNDIRAAMVELALVFNYAGRLNFAQASGWFAKAARRLEGVQTGPAHGYLAVTEALFKLGGGDPGSALELAKRAGMVAEQHGDTELRALGQVFQGQALSQLGRLNEAAPLFDEAMACATDGELGPLATGLVYCRTICACLDAFDYSRARDWTETIDQVAADHCTEGFPGDCRVHRATLLSLQGDWAGAEVEARMALNEVDRIDLSHSALANYEIGLLRLRSGDFAAAATAFARARELGMTPQPGLALLQLETGDVKSATASIRTAVDETVPGSLRRAHLLQAQAEIARLDGDAATAIMAADSLARIAATQRSTALNASSSSALGVASLAEGKPAAALGQLRDAYRLWLEVPSPYDAARIRVLSAAALVALNDAGSARSELEASRAVFDRLGAHPDAARTSRSLAELG